MTIYLYQPRYRNGANMDYNTTYNRLIERSKTRKLIEDEYYELHHIIPRCLGGTNDPDNLTYLTAREHYIAHQLLCKIYPTNHKLLFAAMMMCVDSEYRATRRGNRLYEWLRKTFSENHPSKTELGKTKIKNGLDRYLSSDEWEERRNRIHEKTRETRVCSCGCGTEFIVSKKSPKKYINIQHSRRNKKHSEVTKLRQSESMKKKLSSLSGEEMDKRLRNSLGGVDHNKRGEAISKAKKGKPTRQQEIVGVRYAQMSDEEFDILLATKAQRIHNRMIRLRMRYMNEVLYHDRAET